MSDEAIARAVAAVRERIAGAARRAGRDPGEVTLVAASKTVPPERVMAARDAGIEVFGENRVQEAEPKIAQVDGVRWHLIGHLQRNKARRAVRLFELIHSLDSLKLGHALDRLGVERGRPVEALIEVNVAGEASKAGVPPDAAAELAAGLAGRDGLLVRGLMTIPPPVDEPDRARPWFRALRELAGSIGRRRHPGVTMETLSMGMTDDFEVAVEEGATHVRVGRALFGER